MLTLIASAGVSSIIGTTIVAEGGLPFKTDGSLRFSPSANWNDENLCTLWVFSLEV